MIATRTALVVTLVACSPMDSGIRTPEHWTLDKNSMYRDLRDGLLSQNEKHAYDVIHEEYLDANADGVEEVIVEAANNIEALGDMIKLYHERIAINKKLWQALLDYEDSTCFRRRAFEQLEVHLRARVSFQRKAGESPEVEVLLGLPNLKVKPTESIIDGGSTVYVYNFTEPLATSMEDINQITLRMKSPPTYHQTTYTYGQGHCTKRAWLGTFWCTKRKQETDTHYYEGDAVIVDGIDIYARYSDDGRNYLIYSSLTANKHQPLAILSGVTPIYSVPSYHSNPHWVLHYYSSDCSGWGTADHDQSDFGREIWRDYASKGIAIGNDVMRKKFACKDKRLTGIATLPPDLIETYDEAANESPENVWDGVDLYAETKHTCEAVEAGQLIEQAKKEVDTLVLSEEKIHFDTSVNHKPEVLQEKRDFLDNELETLANSNIGLAEDFNYYHQIGCFYDRELPDGINIEVSGQVLSNIGGRLLNDAEAREQISNNLASVSEASQLFIGFGYAKELAYLGNVEGEDDDGSFTLVSSVQPGYTKNFTLRDMSYVHLARNFSEKFFQTLEGQVIFRNNFWGGGEGNIKTNSLQVERRVLGISSIQLSIGQEGDANNPKQVLYELKLSDEESNDYGVKPALFVLNNTSAAWTDFGLKGNARWREYRRDNNLCASK